MEQKIPENLKLVTTLEIPNKDIKSQLVQELKQAGMTKTGSNEYGKKEERVFFKLIINKAHEKMHTKVSFEDNV